MPLHILIKSNIIGYIKYSVRSDVKMRKYLVHSTEVLLSLGLQGYGDPSLDEIKDKIVKVEIPNVKYTTVNKTSGAYSKYQIMPRTAKHYTSRLKIPHSQWKTL